MGEGDVIRLSYLGCAGSPASPALRASSCTALQGRDFGGREGEESWGSPL